MEIIDLRSGAHRVYTQAELLELARGATPHPTRMGGDGD
jgi:hypothetical protein